MAWSEEYRIVWHGVKSIESRGMELKALTDHCGGGLTVDSLDPHW